LISSIINNNKRSKVIFYHDLHSENKIPYATNQSTPVSLFMTHLEIIHKSGFQIVPAIHQNESQLEINFDDGYRGIYENKDLLIKNQAYSTVFLITSKIGEPGFLSREEILELNSSGYFQFGIHTHTHRNLVPMEKSELENELKKSKNIVETILNQKITRLAFPRGIFSKQVINLAEESGLEQLYSSLPGAYHEKFLGKVICRSLVQFCTPVELKLILKGADKIFFSRYLHRQYFKE
jgi:peptidoglycan/xylan/chitin deacetylase (PgdA/CDA1 family)